MFPVCFTKTLVTLIAKRMHVWQLFLYALYNTASLDRCSSFLHFFQRCLKLHTLLHYTSLFHTTLFTLIFTFSPLFSNLHYSTKRKYGIISHEYLKIVSFLLFEILIIYSVNFRLLGYVVNRKRQIQIYYTRKKKFRFFHQENEALIGYTGIFV